MNFFFEIIKRVFAFVVKHKNRNIFSFNDVLWPKYGVPGKHFMQIENVMYNARFFLSIVKQVSKKPWLPT